MICFNITTILLYSNKVLFINILLLYNVFEFSFEFSALFYIICKL